MNATSRIWYGTLLAAVVWPQAAALAATPAGLAGALFGPALVGQADSADRSPRERRAQAVELVGRGRQAMQEGKLELADSLISRAEKLEADFGYFHLGDTPAKARRDLARVQAADKPQRPSDRFKASTLLDRFGGPAQDGGPAEEDPFRAAGASGSLPVSSDDDSKARVYLFKARKELSRGDVEQAKHWYRKTIALNATFGLDEDSPEALLDDIRRAGGDVRDLMAETRLGAAPQAGAPSERPTPPPDEPGLFPPPQDHAFMRNEDPFGRGLPVEPPAEDNLGRFESVGTAGPRAPTAHPGVPDDIRRHSDGLIVAARKALARGDARQASELVSQARQLGVPYDAHADSPAKVEAAIVKTQQLAGAHPGQQATEPFRRAVAESLLEQADALLRWQALDEAQHLAFNAARLGVSFGPNEAGPQVLLEQIEAARHGGPSTPASAARDVETAADPRAITVRPDAALAADETATKRQVQALLAQARQQLAAGDLPAAERLARQAESLRLPDSAFADEEDRPWAVLLEIQSARLSGAAPSPAATGVLPGNDASLPDRNVAQTAFSEPVDRQQRAGPLPSQPGEADVARPFDFPDPTPQDAFGDAAPAQPVRPAAAIMQSDEGAPVGEFDVQFDDATSEMPADAEDSARGASADGKSPNRGADGSASEASFNRQEPGDGEPGTLIDETDADRQILERQLYTEIAARLQAARAMTERDPQRSLEMLEEAKAMIEASSVSPPTKERFTRVVERHVSELEQYMEANRSRIELDARNNAVRAEVERDRQHKIEVQNKFAALIDEYNKLMDERRFAEAEVIAKRASELDPQNPVAVQVMRESRLIRQMRNQGDIANAKEDGFLNALASVDRSSIPFDDSRPLQFGPVREWNALTERRRRPEEGRVRTEAELKIEQKLRTPVELNFEGAPLGQALRLLAELAKVNLHIDQEGLAQEGITTDSPVWINLTDPVSLKSALNLILEERHLTYVIKDETLTITSAEVRHGKIYPVTYNVADLVIPIPNFVPSGRIGLTSMLHDAYGALGYGNPPGFGANQAPLGVLASSGIDARGASPGVLAQVGGPSGIPGMGSQPMGFGPGGAGGGALADFDSLIQLITSTVGSEEDWEETGGPGRIEPFPLNLSLVISTTEDLHQDIVDLLEQLRRLQDLQVTIEVRFITLSDSFFERIGVDFNMDIPGASFPAFVDRLTGADTNIVVGTAGPQGPGPLGNFTADLDIPFRQGSFGLATPPFGAFSPGAGATLGFAILSDLEAFFFIEASQADSRTNILQAPKVTLFNGQFASVVDFAQSPFVISVVPVVGDFAAAQQPVIVVLNEGTQLSVQAVVSPDRRFVRLTLVPMFSKIGDVDTFTFTGTTTTTNNTSSEGPDDATTARRNDSTQITSGTTVQLPTLATFSVSTTVSVPDGGSILLGGIKRLSEGRTEAGVPMLNKLPYINRLFKNVGIGRETTSLMMMVTPRIIIQAEEEMLLEQGQAAVVP